MLVCTRSVRLVQSVDRRTGVENREKAENNPGFEDKVEAWSQKLYGSFYLSIHRFQFLMVKV